MVNVVIYGASDDLIEVEGDITNADEFSRPDGKWHGTITAPSGEALSVYVEYRRTGTWSVAIGQADEDTALPDWPIVFVQGDEPFPTYSVVLHLEVPDDSILIVDL